MPAYLKPKKEASCQHHLRVAIIDYEAGNLFSVQHACRAVGLNTAITSSAEEISGADAVILPGVGAFGPAMDNLRRLDLIRPLVDFARSGKPLLGICLGMQLLFSESEEFGSHEGLDIIQGKVVRFPDGNRGGKGIRVPQMGWNQVWKPSGKADLWNRTPLEEVKNGGFMYFVHSYYARPSSQKDVLSFTSYEGIEYCSSVVKGNVMATQFHPEKSAEEGMKIYRYWADHISACKED